MSGGPVSFDALAALWQEGQHRIDSADPADRAAMERVTDALVAELRRRLGGPFTVADLAALYLQGGTDWCFDTAVRIEPSRPAAWDLTAVAGAAFARHAREASDYSFGRRITPPEPDER